MAQVMTLNCTSWQTFEETSGYVRPERVDKWPNSMTDIWWWWWWWWWIVHIF